MDFPTTTAAATQVKDDGRHEVADPQQQPTPALDEVRDQVQVVVAGLDHLGHVDERAARRGSGGNRREPPQPGHYGGLAPAATRGLVVEGQQLGVLGPERLSGRRRSLIINKKQ